MFAYIINQPNRVVQNLCGKNSKEQTWLKVEIKRNATSI